MLFYELSLAFCFSFFLAVLASFFNVVIFRTAREQSFSKGRSKCDYCHKQITWHDNVPLFSFIILGGKCRFCQKKIPLLYFLTELLAFLLGIAFYFIYLNSPFLQNLPPLQLILGFLILFTLLFVFLADLQYFLVPDFFVILLSILALFWQMLFGQGWQLPILALFFSTGFFCSLYFLARKLLKKEALGLGDIKLMMPLALILSWPKIVLSIFLAFIIGGIFAMLVLITGRKKIGQALPFAPFLIAAAIISFGFGEVIWQWYFNLFF